MAATLPIGGLTPLTTVDYPGELSAVLFCQGCPWRCRFCHNGHLIPTVSEDRIPWTKVQDFLERRIGLIDAVVFSGGEPTLHFALAAAMREVRSMGFKIGLHTAGPYPNRLRRLLPYLDWVGLDIKELPDRYPQVTGVPGSGLRAWDSLRLLLDAEIALEVRTTLMPGWSSEGEVRPLVDELVAAGVRNHVLQRCRTESVLDPSLTSKATRSCSIEPQEIVHHLLQVGIKVVFRHSVDQAKLKPDMKGAEGHVGQKP